MFPPNIFETHILFIFEGRRSWSSCCWQYPDRNLGALYAKVLFPVDSLLFYVYLEGRTQRLHLCIKEFRTEHLTHTFLLYYEY